MLHIKMCSIIIKNSNKKIGKFMGNRTKEYRQYFLFLSPAMIILLFIYANSIVRIVWYSVIKWKSFTPLQEVSYENFYKVFTYPHFLEILKNNFIIIIVTIPVVVIFALFCAQFLYFRVFGYRIYRYLFFLPVILPNVVAAIIWSFILHEFGVVNTIFQKIGLEVLTVNWFGNPKWAIYGLILTIIWKDVGFAIILFLAKLSMVDPQLYDAAKVDGANEIQTIKFITIPQILSVIVLYIILELIGLLNFIFGYVFVMTRGGPGYSTTPLEFLTYLFAFRLHKFGMANASAVILFVITLILVLIYFNSSRKKEV